MDARADDLRDPDPHALPIGYEQPDISAFLDAGADFTPRVALGIPHAGPVCDLPPLPYLGADRRADADGHRAPGRGADTGPDDPCPEPLCDLHPGGPGRHVVTCPRADLDTLRDAYLDALHEQRADARDLYWRIARHPDFVGHG